MDIFRPWSVFALRRPKGAPAVPRAQREPLDGFGRMLMGQLPREVSLEHTARQFPHVVNRVARAWTDPAQFDREMRGLLLAEKTRQGFPFEVVIELGDLRAWYESRTLATRGSQLAR